MRENSEYHNFGHSVTRKIHFLFWPKTKFAWVLRMKLSYTSGRIKGFKYSCMHLRLNIVNRKLVVTLLVCPTQDRSYAMFVSSSSVVF